MRPAWTIRADSTDITAAIRDYLSEMRIEDGIGDKPDSITLTIDGDGVTVPRTGALLEASIGYRDTPLVKQGLYKVDEIEVSGPPTRIRITAGAANYREKMKAHKSRSWRGRTLGAVINVIAAEHGLKPRIDAELGAIELPHKDQVGESDLHFLRRIARDYGAVVKPADGNLILAKRGQGKSVSGKSIPSITLNANDVTTWRGAFSERLRFTAVTARWHDTDAGHDIDVNVGDRSGPIYTLKQVYRDASAARHAAQAKMEALRRGKASLSITMPGRPAIQAESLLTITDIAVIRGSWTITKTTHAITSSGFTTSIEAESA